MNVDSGQERIKRVGEFDAPPVGGQSKAQGAAA